MAARPLLQCLALFAIVTGAVIGEEEHNQKNHMEKIRQALSVEQGYDASLSPNQDGEEAIDVGISMYILSIPKFCQKSMVLTALAYFRQTWNDPRLAVGTSGIVDSSLQEKIWKPDTFFISTTSAEVSSLGDMNRLLKVSDNGTVLISSLIEFNVHCPMDLAAFPFDTQICSLEVESFKYHAEELNYSWLKGDDMAVGYQPNIGQSTDFSLLGHRMRTVEYNGTIGNYSRVSLDLMLSRNPTSLVPGGFLAPAFVVVVSWLSFWLDRGAITTRVGLGTATTLASTAFLAVYKIVFPTAQHFTAFDIYLIVCLLMTFLALAEYTVVSFGNYKNLDKWSRVLFPLIFIIFLVIFFVFFLTLSPDLSDDWILKQN